MKMTRWMLGAVLVLFSAVGGRAQNFDRSATAGDAVMDAASTLVKSAREAAQQLEKSAKALISSTQPDLKIFSAKPQPEQNPDYRLSCVVKGGMAYGYIHNESASAFRLDGPALFYFSAGGSQRTVPPRRFPAMPVFPGETRPVASAVLPAVLEGNDRQCVLQLLNVQKIGGKSQDPQDAIAVKAGGW